MKQYILSRPVTCVKFADLSQSLRWEVISKHSPVAIDNMWTEYVVEVFAEEMFEKYGIDVREKDTCFLVADRGEFAAWKLNKIVDEEKLLRAALNFEGEELEILSKHISMTFMASPSRYERPAYQTSDCRVDVCDAEDYWEREDFYDALERKVIDRWEEFCRDRAHDLLTRLSKEYEYLTSEEYFAEDAEQNDWIFDVDTGDLYWLSQYPDATIVDAED